MSYKKFSKKFGRNIKAARRKRGLTQTELAEMIGVIPQTISSYECGRTEPELIRLLLISNVLATPIDDLIPNCFHGGRDAEAGVVEENRT